jgi:hypothetical protein
MVTPKNNRTNHQIADQKLLDGIQKNTPAMGALFIKGVSYKPADLALPLQARIDSANRVLAAKAAWSEAVQADRDEQAKSKTFVSDLRQALKVAFGGSIEALATFGLTPRKTPVLTPEQRTAAAEKAKATRAARHTMGPKQKAQIKGTVAPAATPATPAPAAAPATPAPAAPSPVAAAAAPAAAGGAAAHGA